MNELRNGSSDVIRSLMKVGVAIVCVPALLYAGLWYANWSAERSAQVFCDGIPLGSDITLEIVKFEKEIGFRQEPGGKVSVRHYGFPQEGFSKDRHTFLFNGFWYDKAYCDVSIGPDGKVTAKKSFIQYD